MNWQKELKNKVKGKIIFNEPLSRHTTFRIGGKAECWIEPKNKEDLKNILIWTIKRRKPVFVIGVGSNLLVKDRGIRGLVINLSQPYFKQAEFINDGMRVSAGLGLARLTNIAQRKGLAGCEFLVGIPGTVGGALLMNAGVRADCIGINRYLTIGDLVEEVQAIRYNGEEVVLRKKDLKFSYRASNLVSFIIVAARLKLIPAPRREIKKRMEKFWWYKKMSQELNRPNAGCIFKNPIFNPPAKIEEPFLSAGQLIDLCGLKGLSRGGAIISQRHANFILNNGNAKARDVIALMEIAQRLVRERFNLKLIPEIRIVGQ